MLDFHSHLLFLFAILLYFYPGNSFSRNYEEFQDEHLGPRLPSPTMMSQDEKHFKERIHEIFSTRSIDDIKILTAHENHMIAVAAAWRILIDHCSRDTNRRTGKVNRRTLDAELNRFFGFVNARIGTSLPTEFEQELIKKFSVDRGRTVIGRTLGLTNMELHDRGFYFVQKNGVDFIDEGNGLFCIDSGKACRIDESVNFSPVGAVVWAKVFDDFGVFAIQKSGPPTTVICVNRLTGVEVWRSKMADTCSYPIGSIGPDVMDRFFFSGSTRGDVVVAVATDHYIHLEQFNITTGECLFRFNTSVGE